MSNSNEIEKLKEEIKNLKEENFYLKQIKNAMDKTIILSKTDPEGIITEVNEMFEKISGYKKEELIGKPHNIVRHPDVPKLIFKKLWNTIKKGKIFKGVIKNRAKDGKEYYVIANIVPIFDEEGKIKEYIALRVDITKRMKAQKEYETFSNNIIKYFLFQLNDPVSNIIKYSKLLEKELKTESAKNFNLAIQKNAYDLNILTKILKIIIDLKTKNIKIDIEPFNLVSLLLNVLKKYNIYNTKKIIIKSNSKYLLINSDKKLISILLEALIKIVLRCIEKEAIINIIKDNDNIHFKVKLDKSCLNIKSIDFFNQLKASENSYQNNIELYLVSKIANIFDYKVEIKEKEINFTFTEFPPVKFLKK
ncbi:MAG TPA: PAS domain S-box protein [Nautiliaceae bacterium]|nr:PAS domain S-box protein [Nautiliaceae bacterium]